MRTGLAVLSSLLRRSAKPLTSDAKSKLDVSPLHDVCAAVLKDIVRHTTLVCVKQSIYRARTDRSRCHQS